MTQQTLVTFQTPYFGSFFKSSGILLETIGEMSRVKITNGHMTGHTTDIPKSFIVATTIVDLN